ncbi:MAG: GH3 auxin-responsive promoter family protein [Chitinophagales bacterium]|nr:GH3 auxin-responsive promoter family protein [Chitinophagales bacterium]MDW8394488.1 GH3 auxin-responsive promoter family protein [Chitinophagales bacterium]
MSRLALNVPVVPFSVLRPLYPMVQGLLRQRMAHIRHWIDYPLDAQLLTFRRLLAAGTSTEWGKKFDFASLRHPDQFRQRIPLQDYESLLPFIRRMMQGEPNILWPGRIRWFAKSSGTTSERSKYIPVSRESIYGNHFKASMDLLACYCSAYPQTRLLRGKGIIVGGSHHSFEGHVRTGDLSAVLMQNMSLLARSYRAPALSTALMDRWEEKVERLARETLREDITNFSGVPSWTLLLMKKVMELGQTDDLLRVWPNLELYIHGGVAFAPYRQSFNSFVPSGRLRYMEVYNASEGFFAFTPEPDDADLVLHLSSGVFFEFIPESEFGKEQPATRLLHEVERGKLYGLVVSTSGGLWRYNTTDTVRFTSVRPYKIQVSGRMKFFINVFGEEVIQENAESALQAACKATGAVAHEYTVAPVFLTTAQRGRHEWLVEFEQPPSDLSLFVDELDQALRRVNSDYDAKRQSDLALLQPLVRPVPRGTFYSWLKSKNKLGGQHKVPRLSNDRLLVEEILSRMANAPAAGLP